MTVLHTTGPDQNALAEATRLTRAGRLTEATALIQRALAGQPAPSSPGADVPAPHAGTGPSGQAQGGPGPSDRTAPWGGTAPRGGTGPSGEAGRTGGRLAGLLDRLREQLPPVQGPAATAPVPSGMARRLHRGPHGERPYLLYVPPTPGDAPVPLVMMLHGGTQDGATFAAATAMNSLAEREGFIVAYPEQVTSANPMRYWNWFSPTDQRRGAGEVALLADIVTEIGGEHPVDAGRVYVAGFSAGAAMAAVLGEQYPEVFAAVGVHSGLASGSAHDVGSAFAAMRQAPPSRPAGGATRVIVFHGDADPTVDVSNASAVATQFCPSPVDVVLSSGSRAKPFTRKVLREESGRTSELWTVHGAGHAWSGGTPGGSYTDPQAPDASAEMVRFFLTA